MLRRTPYCVSQRIIREEGMWAFYFGMPEGACPYEIHTECWSNWTSGFSEARARFRELLPRRVAA